MESDRESIKNLYLANGFLEATVEAQALDNYKGKEGDLVIRFCDSRGEADASGVTEDAGSARLQGRGIAWRGGVHAGAALFGI